MTIMSGHGGSFGGAGEPTVPAGKLIFGGPQGSLGAFVVVLASGVQGSKFVQGEAMADQMGRGPGAGRRTSAATLRTHGEVLGGVPVSGAERGRGTRGGPAWGPNRVRKETSMAG